MSIQQALGALGFINEGYTHIQYSHAGHDMTDVVMCHVATRRVGSGVEWL